MTYPPPCEAARKIETIDVIPKNVPPTSTRILALCQILARSADQQPKAIARKMAPMNRTANALTDHGHTPATKFGYAKNSAPITRLISDRKSRKSLASLPSSTGRLDDMTKPVYAGIMSHVPLHFANTSFLELVSTASVKAIRRPLFAIVPFATIRPLK